jgi:hypothetical protein
MPAYGTCSCIALPAELVTEQVSVQALCVAKKWLAEDGQEISCQPAFRDGCCPPLPDETPPRTCRTTFSNHPPLLCAATVHAARAPQIVLPHVAGVR